MMCAIAGAIKNLKTAMVVKRPITSGNIAIIGLIAIALVWFISDIFQSDIGGSAPPGKVWSEEHGHYHDIAGSPSPRGINPGQASLNVPQPAGPVPEGKVWSTEHGHWHDIAK